MQLLGDTLPEQENFVHKINDQYSFYQIIDCLNGQEKEVIVNRVLWEFTFKEISYMMKIPISSVSSLYYRGLDKLKIKLENY